MIIQLFHYNGRRDAVNKVLPLSFDCVGDLHGLYNVLHPNITVRNVDTDKYNYAYIPSLSRYYFIASKQVVGDRVILSLDIDVLMTYQSAILAATATKVSGDDANKYISTRNNVYSTTPQYDRANFANSGLFTEDGSIIMVTIKGNK